jgi:TRAP-type C4-dicarboxylate transport system permease small subunit
LGFILSTQSPQKLTILTKPLSFAGALVLFAMMLLTTCDVIGRYIFNAPLLGTFELTEFMMVCLVFFALAYTQSQKGHIAVDIVVSHFPENIQNAIEILNYLITLFVLVLITWMSIERGFEVKSVNEVSGTLQIPVYPFVFCVALGSAAMGLETLVNLIAKLQGWLKS